MRQSFEVDTDTGAGAWRGIGPNTFGTIRQIAWKPTIGDTGADLQIVMLPTRSDDTGSGFLIFDDADCLGADFMKAPRQRFHGPDGNMMDTGQGAPIVLEGERLAVKVIL